MDIFVVENWFFQKAQVEQKLSRPEKRQRLMWIKSEIMKCADITKFYFLRVHGCIKIK